MHVLVTRPVQDAGPFKTSLEALGCRVSIAPLIETLANDISLDALSGATGIVVTSRNALAALAKSPALPSAMTLPLYVVGPGTAAEARRIGFTQIVEGTNGRAEGLVPVVAKGAPAGGRLIYLRGDEIAYDLAAALAESGVNVVSVLAYRSIAADTLPAAVIKELQTGGIDVITLMSPRTAKIWSSLTAEIMPPVQLSGVIYVCLSERVRGALGPSAKAGKVLVPSHPNVEEMLALVKRLAAGWKAE
ncbi:MAG: uroporphyrinogen-III synthase [Hyphomicrobium sp.]|uniref:uroporphyrinogen-III synthase n=1 Tax=Hyphomicrobium sp. TaxID=82 RepID=UPI0039E4B4C2